MRNPAIRAGLIAGVIVIIVRALQQVVDVAVIQSVGALPDPTTDRSAYIAKVTTLGLIAGGIALVVLIIDVVLYLFAGRSAASKTGRVGTGAIAGLVAGILAGVVGAIIAIALHFAGVTTSLNTNTSSVVTPQALDALAIVGAIFGAVIEAGIGAGAGALGGLMGRNTYQKANPPAMPGAYPPPGSYPQGPMQ